MTVSMLPETRQREHYPPLNKLTAFESLGHYVAAAYSQPAARQRELATNITSENPVLQLPGWVTGLQALTSAQRPLIEHLGGAQKLPEQNDGGQLTAPKWDGAIEDLMTAQSPELAEIASVKVSFSQGGAALVTLAGGARSSRQLLDRPNEVYLTMYFSLMMQAFATATQRVFAAQLDDAATVTTTAELDLDTPAGLATAVSEASALVEDATGAPATVVLLSRDAWPVMGAVGSDGHQLYPGRMVDGLPVARAGVDLEHPVLALNATAAQWWEDGPYTISAEKVSNLGVDTAVYGMGHGAVYTAKGIVAVPAAA